MEASILAPVMFCLLVGVLLCFIASRIAGEVLACFILDRFAPSGWFVFPSIAFALCSLGTVAFVCLVVGIQNLTMWSTIFYAVICFSFRSLSTAFALAFQER